MLKAPLNSPTHIAVMDANYSFARGSQWVVEVGAVEEAVEAVHQLDRYPNQYHYLHRYLKMKKKTSSIKKFVKLHKIGKIGTPTVPAEVFEFVEFIEDVEAASNSFIRASNNDCLFLEFSSLEARSRRIVE